MRRCRRSPPSIRKLPDALRAQAVDESLAPYFKELERAQHRRALRRLQVHFRPRQPPPKPESDDRTAPASDAAPLFFWYFFPLRNRIVAWEATTGTGRATYFFRADGPLDECVARITRGLALVNFRREPVYLPDDSLEQQPRYRRYAIGARKLPDLRALRAAYIGRAIHSSLENWITQVVSLTGQP